MTTHDIGTDKLLTPAHKCTENDVTFQDSIGLPSTDYPLMSQKVANFKSSISTQMKNFFHMLNQNLEKENITTLERGFLV